ncbi:MAG: hypothetical protein V5804_11635 [Mucilaginibacter sp.]
MPDRLRAAFSPTLLGGYLQAALTTIEKQQLSFSIHLIYTDKRSI